AVVRIAIAANTVAASAVDAPTGGGTLATTRHLAISDLVANAGGAELRSTEPSRTAKVARGAIGVGRAGAGAGSCGARPGTGDDRGKLARTGGARSSSLQR